MRKQIEEEIIETGKRTIIDLGIHGLHPELIRLVGKMKYRSSYGQNLLQHSRETANLCAVMASELGLNPKRARRAGLLHDIGNTVNRCDHAQSGAFLAFELLRARDFPVSEVTAIVTAIGHHDEKTAAAVSPLAAALILADKSDVRNSRVRNKKTVQSDIHDRVNYSVVSSSLDIEPEKKLICLTLIIDTLVCPVMEYFEIFLDRMVLCKKSAEFLGCDFELIINDTRLL